METPWWELLRSTPSLFWGRGRGHSHGMWKFLGQGLNLCHSIDPSYSGGNTGSLTCNIVLTIVTMLCITFSWPYLLSGSLYLSLGPHPPATLATINLFFTCELKFCVFLVSFCLDFTYKWDHMVSVFLCLILLCSVPKVHLCCHKWQDFLFFTAE